MHFLPSPQRSSVGMVLPISVREGIRNVPELSLCLPRERELKHRCSTLTEANSAVFYQPCAPPNHEPMCHLIKTYHFHLLCARMTWKIINSKEKKDPQQKKKLADGS